MTGPTIDAQAYLLAKAARSAWRKAKGYPSDAIAILADRIADDAVLRTYVAAIAISEINQNEFDRLIGPSAGSA